MENRQIRFRLWVTIGIIVMAIGLFAFASNLFFRMTKPKFNAQLSGISWDGKESLIMYSGESNGPYSNIWKTQLLKPDGTVLKEDNFLTPKFADPDMIFIVSQKEPIENGKWQLEQLVGSALHSVLLPQDLSSSSSPDVLSLSPDKRFLLLQTASASSNNQRRQIYIFDRRTRSWSKNIIDHIPPDLSTQNNTSSNLLFVEWEEKKDHSLFIYVQAFNKNGGLDKHIARFTFDAQENTLRPYSLDADYGPLKVNREPEEFSGMCNSPTVFFQPAWCDASHDSDISVRITNPLIGKQRVVVRDNKTQHEQTILSWFSTRDRYFVHVKLLGPSKKILVAINENFGIYDLGSGKFAKLLTVPYDPDFLPYETQIIPNPKMQENTLL